MDMNTAAGQSWTTVCKRGKENIILHLLCKAVSHLASSPHLPEAQISTLNICFHIFSFDESKLFFHAIFSCYFFATKKQ